MVIWKHFWIKSFDPLVVDTDDSFVSTSSCSTMDFLAYRANEIIYDNGEPLIE